MRSDIQANLGRNSIMRGIAGAFYNPGLLCVLLYRLSARFSRSGLIGYFISTLIWRFNVLFTGAYLSPNARIGPGLRLPHPIGIVIGDGARIGSNVTIYQNVTLGVSDPVTMLYPTVGNDVAIYCGAVLLGDIRIGDNAVIGANAVVLKDVPDGMTAVGVPATLKAGREMRRAQVD